MNKYYFTFGQSHVHSIAGRTVDKDTIGVIKAETYNKARELAFEWFKGEFHNQYDEESLSPDIISYFPKGFVELN